MPIRQGRKVTELTALNSASLNTYVVGVDNNITYKISLDVLEDAVVKIVSSSTDARLDAIEAYTASFSASTDISSLNSFTSSTDNRLDNIEQSTSSFFTEVNSNPSENNFVAVFGQENTLQKGAIFVTGSRVIVGGPSASVHEFVPEAFAVYSQLDGYNLISGHGTTNNYLQLNIKNFSNLSNASSDVVATADNGDEESFYVNMGINGSGYDEDTIIGRANDAYVYGYGNVFHIGNAAEEPVIIFAGGFDARGEHLKMVIDPFNNHTMTGSLEISGRLNVLGGLTGSIDYSNLTNVPTLISSSQQITDLGFGAGGGVINSASFATTGSNIFNGTQTISGSVYVTGDMIIYGSSSLQNVSASAINIGSNTIYINTFTPLVRYAGITVFDSGSSGGTGSILWDSQHNNWIYQNPQGEEYTSAKFIAGPTSSVLGEEVGLNIGRLVVAQADDHISSSQIIDDGSTITIPGTLNVIGRSLFGSGSFNNLAPEKFLVIQDDPDNYNIVVAEANTNNYSQLLVWNKNNGISASSDVVVQADNGGETNMYADLGINSSGYTGNGNGIGAINDAYVYGKAKNFWVGNLTTQSLYFFANENGIPDITLVDSIFHISGSLIVSGGITGSLDYLNIINKPNLISGSSQLTASYDGRYALSGSGGTIPTGTISGSSQLTSSYDLRYVLSGTIQIPANGLISSSAQITDFGFISSSTDITSLNTFTASYYIDSASLFDSIQNLENSTSSYETTGRGILSGSVSYTELTNIPLGIVSGSSQLYSDFSQLNSNNTFIGDQTITGNLNVSNGISASSITVQTFYAVSSSVESTSGSTSFGSTNSDFMNVTGSLNVTNTISASTFVGLGNLSVYSSSVENKFILDRLRLTSLELVTSSYETKGRGIVSSSSQIISILTPLNTYTGSNDTKWTTIQNITSSLISVTASYETRGRGIISGSSQLTSSYDLRYTLSGSVQPLPSGLISGSSQLTSSYDTRYTLSGSIAAVPSGTISGSSQLTASYDLRYAQIGSGGTIPTGTISGSSQLTASYDGRYVQTGSFNTLTASFNSFTASAQTVTTGSNSFNGTQIITGSLIVATGSFVGSVITANTSSLYLTSGSNLYVQNNAVVEITGSLIVSGSTNLIVSNLQIGTGSGNEGGELLLAKAATNTSITGSGVVIDIFQNRLRFFEQGGNSRGGYLDITTLGNSVGTNLSNLTYLLEAYASVTYSLPGSYSNDTCRYSVVNTNINVSSSWFDTSSYTFTPQKAGYWEIIAGYDVYRGSSAEASLFIQKNNSTVAIAGGIGTVSSIVTKIVYLNGSSDNIKIVNNGASINSRSQSSDKSFFQAKFVGE